MKELTPEQRRKVLAAADVVQNGDLAVVKKIVEFTDVIEENTQKIEGIEKKVDDTISEAKQSLEIIKTEADAKLIEIKDGERGIQGEEGKKGDKGERGATGKQGDKGEQGLEGINGLDGQDGLPGADGSPDTRLQIVEKINTGTKKSLKIEAKQVEGVMTKKELDFAIGVLDQRSQFLINKVSNLQATMDSGGGGGASAFTDLTDTFSSYVGKGSEVVRVNAAETALETVALAGGGDALTTDPLSQFAATTSLQLKNTISDETGSGALVFATSPALVTPDLGTPTALVGTNITGTAAGLTAGAVTTNANLTGVVTSAGNATAIADAALSIGKTSGLQTALDAKAPLASPTFTGTVTLPVGLTGVIRTDTGVVSVDSDVTDLVAAASTTAQGKVELAIDSEVNTGTDATRAVTPDALAGSYAGTKSFCIAVFGSTTNTATGNGTIAFVVPSSMNGMNIVAATASVHTAGTTNTTDIMIRRRRTATDADVLSTPITINSGANTASDGVVNTSNDDLATGDNIYVDVDAVSGTPATGLSVVIEARLP